MLLLKEKKLKSKKKINRKKASNAKAIDTQEIGIIIKTQNRIELDSI